MNKTPTPINIDKMLRVLILNNILNHTATADISTDQSDKGAQVALRMVLG